MNNRKENLKLEELRETALKDADDMGKKRRHGLFSQPPPLSIGNKYYTIGKRKVNEDNKVIIEKKGIYTNPSKWGKDRTVYLQKDFLKNPDDQKDTYLSTVDVANLLKKKDMLKMKKGEEDRTKFYPIITKWNVYVDGNDKRIGNPYKNLPEEPIKEKKLLLDENRKVLTKKPNIRTNPMKQGKYSTTVGHLFNNYEYINEDYEAMRKNEFLERKKLNEYNKKLDRPQFKPASLKGGSFNNNKNVFGFKKELPPLPKKKIIIIEKGNNKEPFKPSNPGKKGLEGLLNNKMVYIEHENKGKINQKKKKIILKQELPFYPSTIPKTRPTPSVSLLNSKLR